MSHSYLVMPKKLSTNPKAEAKRSAKEESKEKATSEKQKAATDRDWAEAGEGAKSKAALKKEADVRHLALGDALTYFVSAGMQQIINVVKRYYCCLKLPARPQPCVVHDRRRKS